MPLCLRIRSWLRDYDSVQGLAVRLIYVQICCALIGSLGALFNGVPLINLVVALFALIAIESSSQRLGRTYAVLLLCAIVLDIVWFILFSPTIWDVSSETYGQFFAFSIRLTLAMQIIGFSIRFLSSFLWIQMYRIGASNVSITVSHETDISVRNRFLNPRTHEISRESSGSDDILDGYLYEPLCNSSRFEGARNGTYIPEDGNHISGPNCGSESAIENSKQKLCTNRQYQIIQVDTAVPRPLIL
ncbi:hypothetical protein Cni_G23506 [Canna indica]|uniref:Transmembrane protein n=1 Tax=Canna indica TaxID=4628 RepID=A0AAQ3KU69_9LILI|nr:hypothetical protein Cni_G23506 [Canna indica]